MKKNCTTCAKIHSLFSDVQSKDVSLLLFLGTLGFAKEDLFVLLNNQGAVIILTICASTID